MTLSNLHKPGNSAEKAPKPLSLLAFLTRLILLCVLPLVLLAIYLAVDNVRTLQEKIDHEAEHLAENVATAIDLQIRARIGSLEVLAASPLLDDPPRLNEFYTEAKAFRKSFGGNVILADLSTQMLFNTQCAFWRSAPETSPPKKPRSGSDCVENRKTRCWRHVHRKSSQRAFDRNSGTRKTR